MFSGSEAETAEEGEDFAEVRRAAILFNFRAA
jgi:hypothetical protein